MSISRRVTARYYKRTRAALQTGPAPSGVHREGTDVRNLPVSEARSDLVATEAKISQPTAQPTRSIRVSASLRDARARAEEILRDHPRRDGRTGTTCLICLTAYPCDAVRAAEDVIAITSRLRVGRLLSSKALLEVMTELVDPGAADTA
jgi:hypothetical protein